MHLNRLPLRRMLDLGKRTGRFRATYILQAKKSGDILLRGLQTPEGPLGHVWLPGKLCSHLPAMHQGDRITFIADLKDNQHRDRINLSDVRELEVLP